MKPSNRTLSLDLTFEPISDTSSTVVAIDPVGSLLLWTVFEAIALGFITRAAFNSLRSYHSYPILRHPITNTLYQNAYEDTIEKKRKFINIDSELFSLRNSEWTSDQKQLMNELQSLIFKWFPVDCPVIPRENMTTHKISKRMNNPN